MIIISNTFPLLNLAIVGKLDILKKLFNGIIRPMLDDLIGKAGFWISPELYAKILNFAKENY